MNPLFQDPKVQALLAAQQQGSAVPSQPQTMQSFMGSFNGTGPQQPAAQTPAEQQVAPPFLGQNPTGQPVQPAPMQVAPQTAPTPPAPMSPVNQPAPQNWQHNQQAQYAQHDAQVKLINSMHQTMATPEAKDLQKSLPEINWNGIKDSIEAHQDAMAKSTPDLGYVGNHGVVAATTTAANGGSYMDIASSMLGKTEGADHKVLTQFFQKSGMGEVDPRNTPWCAAYVNSVLQAGGMQGSNSLAARSLLKIGTAVDKSDATKGDVVVFGRGNDGVHGHTGFIDHFSSDGKTVYVLGGNQANSVSISARPATTILGIRRPDAAQIKEATMKGSSQTINVSNAPVSSTNDMGTSPSASLPATKTDSQGVSALDRGLSYE